MEYVPCRQFIFNVYKLTFITQTKQFSLSAEVISQSPLKKKYIILNQTEFMTDLNKRIMRSFVLIAL